MALQRISHSAGRVLLVWCTVAALIASEHHGIVKSAGLPVPGATVTATQGDKKHVTTSDENGRYAFADLADGLWTLDIEMMGFEKLTKEVGIAYDAPSPEWNLKMATLSAITAPKPAAPGSGVLDTSRGACTAPATTPAGGACGQPAIGSGECRSGHTRTRRAQCANRAERTRRSGEQRTAFAAQRQRLPAGGRESVR